MLAPNSNAPRPAVGLYRVSTAEQGQSGLGLEAQRVSVRAFCAAQGWALVAEYGDVASGKDDRRPGFRAALLRCRQLGGMLVAARLDRVTRRAHIQIGREPRLARPRPPRLSLRHPPYVGCLGRTDTVRLDGWQPHVGLPHFLAKVAENWSEQRAPPPGE